MNEPVPISNPVVVIKKRAVAPAAPYVPAIGPRLRVLLYVVFAGFAFLGATGIYLVVITLMNRVNTDQLYTTPFTFWMLIAHIAVGVVGVAPFLVFGLAHWWTARKRSNRVAVLLGVILFHLGIVIIVSGFALIQIEGLPQLPTGSISRNVSYFAHLLIPVAAIFAYIAHRRAGPAIKWKYGREGPAEGMQYFFPSEARTADGKFISERALMTDEYCKKCHADIYNDHLHSAHKFSSFNNPAYLFSIKETRKVALE